MIYSSINAADAQYAWPELFRKAFAFLKNSDLEHMDNGRYEIKGQDVFAIIQTQTTAAPKQKKAESHFKYIDIQYLISGEEMQGFAPLTDNMEREEHPERDIMYYQNVPAENFVRLKPGDFAVYFTNDVHRPNCTSGIDMEIKKAIVKIREEAL